MISYYHHKIPCVSLYGQTFSLGQYWEECPKWPQNEFGMININSTQAYTTYTYEDQIFVRSDIASTLFEKRFLALLEYIIGAH